MTVSVLTSHVDYVYWPANSIGADFGRARIACACIHVIMRVDVPARYILPTRRYPYRMGLQPRWYPHCRPSARLDGIHTVR